MCALCTLEAQGVKNPEQYVLPQYVMTDPTKPVLPYAADADDYLYMVFPEERPAEGQAPPPVGGIMGTAKAIFRALGFGKEIEQQRKDDIPQSGKIAAKRRKSSLYK